MIKKYIKNKIVVYTLILILLCLFYFVPTGETFEIEIVNDNKNYDKNVVYLLDDDNYVSQVITYFDNTSITEDIKNKINVLIHGDNNLNNFYSLIPKTTILKNVKVDKDNVYLDFNKEILNVNEYMEESMIESIIYTLTETNGINNIYINVDGEPLKELPNSKKELPYPLTRDYGINKKYDLTSFNDIDKTTIFFAKTNEEFTYYVPVTKISNTISDKIDIIIEELKSTVNSQDNLNSYINNNVKLVSKEINDEKINLVFNNYIFSDMSNKLILEEVKYILSESIFENYDIKEVIFNTESDKNIDRVVKNN
jgi:spore germination protein GerM